MVRDGRAYKYAQWAVSETEGMVPHYVKVQAQQWMDIVDDYNEDAYVDEKEFEKICNLLKLKRISNAELWNFHSIIQYNTSIKHFIHLL